MLTQPPLKIQVQPPDQLSCQCSIPDNEMALPEPSLANLAQKIVLRDASRSSCRLSCNRVQRAAQKEYTGQNQVEVFGSLTNTNKHHSAPWVSWDKPVVLGPIGELWYLHGPWGGAITRMQSSPMADVSGRAAVNPSSPQEITTAHCTSVPEGTHADQNAANT